MHGQRVWLLNGVCRASEWATGALHLWSTRVRGVGQSLDSRPRILGALRNHSLVAALKPRTRPNLHYAFIQRAYEVSLGSLNKEATAEGEGKRCATAWLLIGPLTGFSYQLMDACVE